MFEFDRLRNFTSVRFHCNNLFSKETRVFRRAVLHFAATSRGYQTRPLVYDFMRDTFIEFARNVIVSVPHSVGRFVRVELYFDAKWMMVSEVRFDSGLWDLTFSLTFTWKLTFYLALYLELDLLPEIEFGT